MEPVQRSDLTIAREPQEEEDMAAEEEEDMGEEEEENVGEEEEEEDMGEEEEENVGEDDQSEAQVHFRPFSVPFIIISLRFCPFCSVKYDC
jgi:hypothetical protein